MCSQFWTIRCVRIGSTLATAQSHTHLLDHAPVTRNCHPPATGLGHGSDIAPREVANHSRLHTFCQVCVCFHRYVPNQRNSLGDDLANEHPNEGRANYPMSPPMSKTGFRLFSRDVSSDRPMSPPNEHGRFDPMSPPMRPQIGPPMSHPMGPPMRGAKPPNEPPVEHP